MVKDFNHGNRKKEKGLTLVETIVSLTVITIISIGALSLAIFATNSRKRLGISRYFSNLEDQCLKLYQAYKDEQFEDAFNVLTGESITYNTDKTLYYTQGYETTSDSNYKYYVDFDFNYETKSLTISAYYNDGELIVERSTSR